MFLLQSNHTLILCGPTKGRKQMALDNKEIGQRIKYRRQEKELSQEELADRVGSIAQYISKVETGTKTPSLEMLVLIANALDTTANDLLGENLTHNSSEIDKHLHDILWDCNADEKGILIKTLQHLKQVLSEYGV